MSILDKKWVVAGILLSLMVSNLAWADEAELTQRIERLERIIQGQGLVSLLGRVDQLQKEVQRLYGDNESLQHQLATMKKRQRELYLDLDQRIQNQEVAAAPVIPTVEPAEPEVAAVDTPDINNTPTEPSPVAVENGEAAYQAALQALRSGQFEQAVTALEAFPTDFPQSSYLPNAYYWQGEAHYVLRNFELAIVAFNKVVNDFSASNKVADATLKLGFSQYEIGQFDAAKATLTSVVSDYPNTSASRLAQVRLDRMKKEAQ